MADIVTPAVQSASTNDRVRLSMELGALLESGSLSGPFGVGDQGHSYGPFQINLPYHPGVTAAQAIDPSFAASYMEAAYEAAVNSIPDALWKSNPEQAAEQAAVIAERPAVDYYSSHGVAAVDAAYGQAIQSLGFASFGGGGSSPLDIPGQVVGAVGSLPGVSTVTDLLNPANWLEDAVKAFITSGIVLRAVLMGSGLIILFIGLSQISKGDQTAAQTVGSGVSTVRVRTVNAGKSAKSTASKTASASSEGAAA